MAASRRIGFYGFGSAAQIPVQLARADGCEVFAFTRDGDTAAQQFAREMGAFFHRLGACEETAICQRTSASWPIKRWPPVATQLADFCR